MKRHQTNFSRKAPSPTPDPTNPTETPTSPSMVGLPPPSSNTTSSKTLAPTIPPPPPPKSAVSPPTVPHTRSSRPPVQTNLPFKELLPSSNTGPSVLASVRAVPSPLQTILQPGRSWDWLWAQPTTTKLLLLRVTKAVVPLPSLFLKSGMGEWVDRGCGVLRIFVLYIFITISFLATLDRIVSVGSYIYIYLLSFVHNQVYMRIMWHYRFWVGRVVCKACIWWSIE